MTRKYHVCGWPEDSMIHLRSCVSRREWPAWAFEKKSNVGTVLEAKPMLVCECGYEHVSAAGMRLHRLNAKVHKHCPSLWQSAYGDMVLQCEFAPDHSTSPGHKHDDYWWGDDSPACIRDTEGNETGRRHALGANLEEPVDA